MRIGWICLYTLLLLSAGSDPTFATGGHEQPRAPRKSAGKAPKWVMEVPLWKLVPVSDRRFAVLGEGVARQMRWDAYVYRAPKSTGKPCVELVTLYFGGPGSGFSVKNGSSCGIPAPPGESPIAVQSGYSVKKTTSTPFVSSEAIGMLFGAEVSSVVVGVSSGGHRHFEAKALSPQQAEKARVKPLRYVVFGVAHRLCLETVSGFSSDGSELVNTTFQECR